MVVLLCSNYLCLYAVIIVELLCSYFCFPILGLFKKIKRIVERIVSIVYGSFIASLLQLYNKGEFRNEVQQLVVTWRCASVVPVGCKVNNIIPPCHLSILRAARTPSSRTSISQTSMSSVQLPDTPSCVTVLVAAVGW